MNDGKLWNISLKSSQIIPQYKKKQLLKKTNKDKERKIRHIKECHSYEIHNTLKKKLEKELDEIYDK